MNESCNLVQHSFSVGMVSATTLGEIQRLQSEFLHITFRLLFIKPDFWFCFRLFRIQNHRMVVLIGDDFGSTSYADNNGCH